MLVRGLRGAGQYLNAQARAILKLASVEVDKDQSVEGAYKHAMSSAYLVASSPDDFDAKAVVQDRFDAAKDAGKFIENNLKEAIDNQLKWEAAGNTGDSPAALKFFGYSLHTVTDAKHPGHEGYQPWFGLGGSLGTDNSGASLAHSFGHMAAHAFDRAPQVLQPRMQEAKHAAIVAARFHWLLYQKRLREERLRRLAALVFAFLRLR
jgi:hypothetical protein